MSPHGKCQEGLQFQGSPKALILCQGRRGLGVAMDTRGQHLRPQQPTENGCKMNQRAQTRPFFRQIKFPVVLGFVRVASHLPSGRISSQFHNANQQLGPFVRGKSASFQTRGLRSRSEPTFVGSASLAGGDSGIHLKTQRNDCAATQLSNWTPRAGSQACLDQTPDGHIRDRNVSQSCKVRA